MFPDIDTLFIGLIRNPMDTLYSSWKRFGVIPEKEEPAWRTAYQNLVEFQAGAPDRVLIVRYEGVVRSDVALRPLESFLGSRFSTAGAGAQMHDRSLQKWRKDRSFGFQLDPETARLAATFGYGLDSLNNAPRRLWPVRSRLRSVTYDLADRLPNNAARIVKALMRRVT
jgi:hypothetical protein